MSPVSGGSEFKWDDHKWDDHAFIGVDAEASHESDEDGLNFVLQEVVLPAFDEAEHVTEHFGDITVIEEVRPDICFPNLLSPPKNSRDWPLCKELDCFKDVDADVELLSAASTSVETALYGTTRALFTILEDQEAQTPDNTMYFWDGVSMESRAESCTD
jgi:hypothetical protein